MFAGRLAESQSFACITAPILSAILTNIQNGKHGRRRTYTSQSEWDREQEIIDEAGGGELVFADTLVTYWDKIVITDPAWRPALARLRSRRRWLAVWRGAGEGLEAF